MSTTQALKVFEDKRIRAFWDDRYEKWLFCINDIVEALTESSDPADYFKTRRKRDKDLDDFVRGSNCPTHSFISTDGKPHAVKCMDLKGIFRIIQSIPSKKAEPFKRWLAQVGAERIHQMQDPELGIQQSLQDYKRLGYSDNWSNRAYSAVGAFGMTMDDSGFLGASFDLLRLSENMRLKKDIIDNAKEY